MEVKFDFTLNSRRFGVVEQAIFKLVLRGVGSAQGISELLWIFSDDVKATAIQKLVNSQALRADLASSKLYLSDGIVAIIGACHDCTYTVEIPEILLSHTTDGTVLVKNRQVIAAILNHILPDISVDFFALVLFFSITEVKCEHE